MSVSLQGSLMVDIAGTWLSAEDRHLLRQPEVAGLIIFARNIQSPRQVRELSASIRAVRPDLILAVDQEGGRVQRLRQGFVRLPAMRAIADNPNAEYLAEQFPGAGLWPRDIAARAQARSACAQMHAGFFAMRGNMPFDLSRDAPLSPVPADVQADIERMLALWAECRAAATEVGPFLFGGATVADAFFAPIAVRLRTYQVPLPAADAAYVETIYQWPAFKAWQRAGLEEVGQ